MNPSMAMSTEASTATLGEGAPPAGTAQGAAGFGGEYRPPLAARMLAVAGAVGVMVTSLFGLYRGGLGSEHAAWFVIAFEVVAILSAAFALAAGLGRFASAAGMTLLCCAGAIGAGAFLARLASGQQVLPTWFFMARGVLTVMLLCAAALAVLARNPGPAARFLTRAALFGVPLVAIVAGAWLARHQLAGMSDTLKLVGGLVGFLVVTGLAAGAVHCAIRAFEVCDEDAALRQ